MKKNKLKIKNWKLKIGDFRRGMTYVELIVVLGIFAVMSSIVMYNYVEFQAKVDIKNLASDIALKIVEAQKSSLSGNLPPDYYSTGGYLPDWKPSYGVHFDASNQKNFVYFADKYPDNTYNLTTDSWGDTITINQNAYISGVQCGGLSVVDIVFRRPDSRAQMKCDAQITVSSPRSASTATITIYSSGRLQAN